MFFLMNCELFVLGNDQMLLHGVELLANKVVAGKRISITVKRVNLMGLMQADKRLKFNKRYSIVVVPDRIYDALRVFTAMENIKMISCKTSIEAFSTLLINTIYRCPNDEERTKTKRNNMFLTARERRFCHYIYHGVSNKNIARHFQCSEKCISYMKKKIMTKWQCKNSVEFYRIINYFFCEDRND